MRITPLLLALAAALPAAAQDTTAAPTFNYAEAPKEDAKPTGWKAEAKLGVLWLAGNAQSTSISSGLALTRDEVWQRYSLTANYAYAKSSIYIARPGVTSARSTDDLLRQESLTARLWNVTPRFDQWLRHRNAQWDTSVYLLGNIGSDFAAGKQLFGGFQLGVSTLLLKEGAHNLVGELGYDFTYLEPYSRPGTPGASYAIHSLRAALAYTYELSKTTKFNAGLEYLTNVNREGDAPNDAHPDLPGVPSFQDNRLNLKISLTTQVYERLSLNLNWTGRFDSKPQLLQLPAGVQGTVFLDKFDSIVQVQFVYTFG